MACVVGWPCVLPCHAEELSIAHGPYLQAVTEDSVTIVWFTTKNCVSHVQYWPGDGPSEGNDVTTVFASHHGLVEANTKIHRIPLTGLTTGQRYAYRVISQEIERFDSDEVTYGGTVTGGPYCFQSLDPQKDEFSFCVVNDAHGDTDELQSLLDQVSWDDTDMAFLNGDMVNHWSRESQVFNSFLDICVKRFARQTPFIYVRGNHDTRGPLARGLLGYFPTPDNQYYYTFRHGPVCFLILDSGENSPDSSEEHFGLADFDAYLAEQTKWLEETVQGESFRNSQYRIVLVHMPPSSHGDSYGAKRVRKLWSAILNEARIDLALCGHTHKFARIDANESANRYPILVNASDTITNVAVSRDRLEVTVRETDGEIAGTIVLKPRSSD